MNAVIFDMDGVLFPTEQLKFRAYQRVFKDEYQVDLQDIPIRLGFSEVKAMELFLGIIGKKIGKKTISKLIELKRKAYYWILSQENFKPYEGVIDFLKKLKNSQEFKIGLATSSNRESVDILLDRFNFRIFFDSVLTVEDVKNPKPDPEIYLSSAIRLGVSPENCLVFEDSPVGVEAAKDAFMKCVAITTGVSADQLSKADMIISSFKQLNIDIIKKL